MASLCKSMMSWLQLFLLIYPLSVSSAQFLPSILPSSIPESQEAAAEPQQGALPFRKDFRAGKSGTVPQPKPEDRSVPA